jgi:hypothetical protein
VELEHKAIRERPFFDRDRNICAAAQTGRNRVTPIAISVIVRAVIV